ncbi:hypothetical protein H5U98_12630 [Mycolicibacterium boenickei]|uniref:Luciferase-like domain-containing protein n=1 Tax=Mycolicibacterium boenickei TaxID=146017 RepID=A0AAX3A4K8_9MYCO|nr:hypothetical protein [Mycolicibacterium boenickei]UNC02145.1 hypothetical protein H5U98_12630 [Mycolicibacterium boenickei]
MIKPSRFGVVASGVEVRDLVATAKQAEGLGFSSIVLNDHVNSAAAPMLGRVLKNPLVSALHQLMNKGERSWRSPSCCVRGGT